LPQAAAVAAQLEQLVPLFLTVGVVAVAQDLIRVVIRAALEHTVKAMLAETTQLATLAQVGVVLAVLELVCQRQLMFPTAVQDLLTVSAELALPMLVEAVAANLVVVLVPQAQVVQVVVAVVAKDLLVHLD
jgi:hypothetical protein